MNIKALIVRRIKSDSARMRWHRFRRNKLSIVGLITVSVCIALALLAPFITPYPASAGFYTNFKNAFRGPSMEHLFGTDEFGRDIFTRAIFGFRYSLTMAAVVLALVAPLGTVLGLVAGYNRGRWVDMAIMRIADIFVAVPPLVLALSICSVLTPSAFNAMIAVSMMWWPWYTKLTYNVASALKNEPFIRASEVEGVSSFHIIFREILPCSLGPILTKLTLDVGWVILLGSALSFVGLGAQPPTPDLGTMVSDGAQYLPNWWWISLLPALAIILIILGFNLLGDGIRDMFVEEAR